LGGGRYPPSPLCRACYLLYILTEKLKIINQIVFPDFQMQTEGF